jgi:DNA primase
VTRKLRKVAEFVYTDERGVPLYKVERHEGVATDGRKDKSFPQFRPDGRGGWSPGLKGAKRVPYHLPLLLASSGRIYIAEGEQHVEALEELGFTATTNSQGAGKWQEEFAPYFRGRDVVLLPDNDTPGRKHARKVGDSLREVASIKVLELPGLAEKGDVIDWLKAGGTREQLESLGERAPSFEQWEHDVFSVDGAALLTDVEAFVRRFVVFPSGAASAATTLWVAHTHAFDAAPATPYIAVTSPEKRSGKSRLQEVCQLLVRQPMRTVNTSLAVLFRAIDKNRPTLFLDETDTVFKMGGEKAEELRGLINAGNRPGSPVLRTVGDHFDIKAFEVFCPKMLSGIKDLPDTVMDRSINIRIQRRKKTEPYEKFRERKVRPEAESLRQRLELWAAEAVPQLTDAEPEIPDELNDRAQDAWEPLIAIADHVGGEWPSRARAAA